MDTAAAVARFTATWDALTRAQLAAHLGGR
jgi:hypothetical protein